MNAPGAWLDEGEVSPAWAPPVGAPVRRSRLSGPLTTGAVLLGLALVVGLVHLSGGFGRRTDQLTPVPPGTLISTGPYELAFTEATAQVRTDGNGATTGWEVVAIGSARVTGDEAMSPQVYGGDGMFALRDPGSGTTANPSGADIGPPGDAGGVRQHLVPGLPTTPYRLTFSLPADFRPGALVQLAVADLVFDARQLTSDEEAWHDAATGSRLDLPLRVLPPETP